MEYESVADVAGAGLCCSCGLCAEVCPVGAVSLSEEAGSWVPGVKGCVGCGRCVAVCPGAHAEWEPGEPVSDQLAGPCLLAASSWSTDDRVFGGAVSGGVATQLVSDLLAVGAYDVAFLAGPAVPGERLDAAPCRAGDDLAATQKSKYVQVSHAGTLRYMRGHPAERAIVVAVPCAVRGLLKAIELLGLDRGNYLFLGLFCDKTMRYGVLDRLAALGGGEVSSVDFRSKGPSGWPGDVVLHRVDGTSEELPRQRRMEVKELFCPERCLYCLDKLNVLADISLGDDYTGDGANPGGANSVLVRTERGMRAWESCAGSIASVPSSLSAVAESQGLGRRADNLAFARAKEARSGCPEINVGVVPGDGPAPTAGLEARLDALLAAASLGERYAEDPAALEREVARRRGTLALRAARKAKAAVKRLLGR